MAISANRLELLQIVDAVAREKSIDRSIVLTSMEDAMQKAARSRYGQDTEVRAEINGRQTPVDYVFGSEHHHVKLRFALQEGKNLVRLHVKNDFGLAYDFRLPALGNKSSDLRVLTQTGDQYATLLTLAGRAGATYDFDVWNPGIIESVDGAEIVKQPNGATKLRIRFDVRSSEEYSRQQVAIHFRQPKVGKKAKLRE